MGFLSEYWQDFFDYNIVGEETVKGREAIRIAIAPKSPREENYSLGNVWIDQRHQVHSVEKTHQIRG